MCSISSREKSNLIIYFAHHRFRTAAAAVLPSKREREWGGKRKVFSYTIFLILDNETATHRNARRARMSEERREKVFILLYFTSPPRNAIVQTSEQASESKKRRCCINFFCLCISWCVLCEEEWVCCMYAWRHQTHLSYCKLFTFESARWRKLNNFGILELWLSMLGSMQTKLYNCCTASISTWRECSIKRRIRHIFISTQVEHAGCTKTLNYSQFLKY